jgi:hypothetical protein
MRESSKSAILGGVSHDLQTSDKVSQIVALIQKTSSTFGEETVVFYSSLLPSVHESCINLYQLTKAILVLNVSLYVTALIKQFQSA